MAEADFPATRCKRPWTLTISCLLIASGLAAMPVIVGPPASTEMPDTVRFFGRFHPILLHLPIGVFALILLQEIGAMFGRCGRAGPSLFPLWFGMLSAIVAALAGFLLYHGHAGEYGDNPLVTRHLWGGLVFAEAAIVTFLAKVWTESLAGNPAFYRMLLFSSVGLMGFTSHDGASLTHGSGYLAAHAPESLLRILGMKSEKSAVSESDPVVYTHIIAPIFERRCVSCHKETKTKGKLRMDTYEMLLKGGKKGSAIKPGSAAESHMIARIDLPEDDEEHMPPEGKPDIEEAEVQVIKWWLDTGADPRKKLSDFRIPAEIKTALARLAPANPGVGK